MTEERSFETLLVTRDVLGIHVILNRPQVRNAMSRKMVEELMDVFRDANNDPSIRIITLRGADGHFCAGGDIQDMAKARASLGQASESTQDPFEELNRTFGNLLEMGQRCPATVIAVCEGTVMGGGVGLACIADVTLASTKTRFALPETTLGLIPAQIAPFLIERMGRSTALRLVLTAEKFDGTRACEYGLAHHVAPPEELADLLQKTLDQIQRCAPNANRVTKQFMLNADRSLKEQLNAGAKLFAESVQSPEGAEGTMAFLQKRKAKWAQTE